MGHHMVKFETAEQQRFSQDVFFEFNENNYQLQLATKISSRFANLVFRQKIWDS